MTACNEIGIRALGFQDYEPVWRAMQAFTETRDVNSRDEIWFRNTRGYSRLA